MLLVLMVIASLFEVLSIGSVLPFLGVLVSPEQVFQYPALKTTINFLGLTNPRQLVLPFTISFATAALMAGAMRVLLIFASTKISYSIGTSLSTNLYEKTLYQSYEIHVGRNSSEIINAISKKIDIVISSLLLGGLTLATCMIMLSVILAVLLTINFWVTFFLFLGFGVVYLSIIKFTKTRLLLNSYRISQESTKVIKLLQEGLGGIRDVLIGGNQKEYCKTYERADQTMRNAQAMNHFISHSPRYIMESVGLVLIALVAYKLTESSNGISSAVPMLGMIGFGAQRLLPMLQQAYSSWSCIIAAHDAGLDALTLLNQPMPPDQDSILVKPIPFHNKLVLSNLYFKYKKSSKPVLEEINLIIKKGSRVGFIGKTGSGKSTLLDIVMGLLEPTNGIIKVDDVIVNSKNCQSWQKNIAHVPQSIFLLDASFEDNIVFGSENNIDYNQLKIAAEQAQIADFIESLPHGYKTTVGERGMQLSGGQRQRIGIARALYKNAKLIILDEATSALDIETEGSIMRVIDELSSELTILIIAHRLSTLRNCDYIVEIKAGRISKKLTYRQLSD